MKVCYLAHLIIFYNSKKGYFFLKNAKILRIQGKTMSRLWKVNRTRTVKAFRTAVNKATCVHFLWERME